MDVAVFVAEVGRLVRRGAVGEHTIRSVFLPQLRRLGPDIEAINEPGATEHGNPDIAVYRSSVPVGWIETKALVTDLVAFEGTDQFRRYSRGFSNLIVTNFHQFRWYVDHRPEPFMVADLGVYRPGAGIAVGKDGGEAVCDLLRAFYRHEARQTRSAAELARRLADYAIAIRRIVGIILENRDRDQILRQELVAFRSVLLPDISENDFADMYAQTITYGLFAARCSNPNLENFNRLNAPAHLPVSNPFLRNVFGNLAGANIDPRVVPQIDQICALLSMTDLQALSEEFKHRTGLADPVVHFYETFLQIYDREERIDRGVYYTPVSVVSFIVRALDDLLKTRLDVREGLFDSSVVARPEGGTHRIQILDPATGTGTFLLFLFDYLKTHFTGQGGLWQAYLHDSLLPRIYGFEYLMAPYAIAHLKLSMALMGQNFEFRDQERLGVYLTNSLEDTARVVEGLPFQNFLTVEADQANQIKQRRPIMAIMGNPPYSIRTANLGPNARRLSSRYVRLDGQPIREGGTLALQRSVENDYVKFIAFAQEQIERTGEGVIGYITANGYLDQPTLAGLRRSLMQTFDEIRIVDLHGYARAGTDDQNVFSQIGEGVAIILMVRQPGDHVREARVRYYSLRGSRSEKRAWLTTENPAEVVYEDVAPEQPDYLFKPESTEVRAKYRGEFVALNDIFEVEKGAIVTARDAFAIGFSPDELIGRLERFRDHRGSAQEASEALGLSWTGDWPRMAGPAKEWLRQNRNWRTLVRPITYRPFDDRYIIYSDMFLDTPASAAMDHIVGVENQNALLLFGRSVRYGMPDQFFVTRKLAEAKSGEASRQCHAAPFLLRHNDLAGGTRPNLKRGFVERVRGVWGQDFALPDVFPYIYGVLNCPTYRQVYAAQICANYARIPFVDLDMAIVVSQLGRELIGIHVGDVDLPLITQFPVGAAHTHLDAMSPRDRWSEIDGLFRLAINGRQYIDGVPSEVRSFRLAGYNVLDKWLQGRSGREIDANEILDLQRVVSRISRTIEIMALIDDAMSAYFTE